MGIERKDNPSLSEYRMTTRKKNWVEYLPKARNEDIMDAAALDVILE